MKTLYLALVLSLAQIIRLSGDISPNGIYMNGRKYFFGFKMISERRKVNSDTGKEIPKNGDVWLIAYFNLNALKMDGDADKQKITLKKNSLRVMICKKPENFDEDTFVDKDKEYYMVQKGKLIGAFEINQDWVREIKKDDTFTFAKLSKIDWSHKLELEGFDWDDFELKKIGIDYSKSYSSHPGNIISEEKNPELQDLTLDFFGFENDTTNPTKIKIVDETTICLNFRIKRDENQVKEDVGLFIFMFVITEDTQLLQALEDKWAALKVPNEKNADPSQSNQILNEDVTIKDQEEGKGTQSQTTQNQEQNSFNDNSTSQEQQNLSGQPPGICEDVAGLNKELISGTSQPGISNIPENSDTLIPNSQKENPTLKEEKQDTKGDKNKKSDKKPESRVSNNDPLVKLEAEKESAKDSKTQTNGKDYLIPNSETDNPILKKAKKEEKNDAEVDKNQKSDNKLKSSASKEKDKSWLENPYIYGGLIVISILGLGLVVYTFYKKEAISEEDK